MAMSMRGGRTHERRHRRQHRRPGGQQRAADPRRQPDGHGHRVLRLLHLRHRRGAGLPATVLPRRRSGHRHAGLARHLRDRLPGPADRVGGVRALRRPHRPQDHAGRGAAHDGRLHRGHRRLAHLPVDRHRRPAAARPVPLRPGPGAGRRMGRRGAAGHRERPARQAGVVRDVPAARRADRLLLFGRHLPAALALAHRGAVLRLGLAGAVPVERGAGNHRPLRAPGDHRDAGVRAGGGPATSASRCRWSPCSPRTPGRWCWGPQSASRLRDLLPDHGVRAVVGHQRARLHTQPVPGHPAGGRRLLRPDGAAGRRCSPRAAGGRC